MDINLKDIFNNFFCEFKKDWKFFGGCGVLVGYFILIENRLKQQYLAIKNDSWADTLLSDFMPFYALAFVFMGFIIISSFATILVKFWQEWPKLEAAVKHIATRITQITSSIISFALGLSAIALTHSIFTLTIGGFIFALLLYLFSFYIFSITFLSAIISRDIKPFNDWKVAMIMFCLSVAAVGFLIIKGV